MGEAITSPPSNGVYLVNWQSGKVDGNSMGNSINVGFLYNINPRLFGSVAFIRVHSRFGHGENSRVIEMIKPRSIETTYCKVRGREYLV